MIIQLFNTIQFNHQFSHIAISFLALSSALTRRPARALEVARNHWHHEGRSWASARLLHMSSWPKRVFCCVLLGNGIIHVYTILYLLDLIVWLKTLRIRDGNLYQAVKWKSLKEESCPKSFQEANSCITLLILGFSLEYCHSLSETTLRGSTSNQSIYGCPRVFEFWNLPTHFGCNFGW